MIVLLCTVLHNRTINFLYCVMYYKSDVIFCPTNELMFIMTEQLLWQQVVKRKRTSGWKISQLQSRLPKKEEITSFSTSVWSHAVSSFYFLVSLMVMFQLNHRAIYTCERKWQENRENCIMMGLTNVVGVTSSEIMAFTSGFWE